MMRHIQLAVLLTLTAAVAGCSPGMFEVLEAAAGQAASSDEFRWEGRLAAGQTVEIKGINGSIDAERATGDRIEIIARKHGRRDDPAEVEIAVIQHAGGVTVCAMYPAGFGRENVCAPGDEGRLHNRNSDVVVEFEARIPAGLNFAGRTVNGGVRAADIDGTVSINSVNGSVEFSTTRYGEAQTVNGSVRARIGDASWDRALAFKTVNGNITLDLPAGLSSDVEVRTLNGSISTDFPLTVSGRFSRRRLEGTIGDGGRRLELSSVNGSIELRRAG